MNFDQPKLVRAQLRKLEKLRAEDRALLLESSQLMLMGAREIWEAEMAVVEGGLFKRTLAVVPNWGLAILRDRIARPMRPERYSMGKLRLIDAAIKKAHASLACPHCSLRQPAKGLHLHKCGHLAGRALSAEDLAAARFEAGIPIGSRVLKSLRKDGVK